MSWATAEQASEVTGKTVTEEDLAVAQPVIDIFSGVVEEQADRLKAKDLRMLRYAVSYQAVWMKGNAGALTGSDVQSATQDSVSFTRFDEGNDDATVLAPLARRCLDRLSWRRSKTAHSRSAWDQVDRYGDAFHDDGRFDGKWRPLKLGGR